MTTSLTERDIRDICTPGAPIPHKEDEDVRAYAIAIRTAIMDGDNDEAWRLSQELTHLSPPKPRWAIYDTKRERLVSMSGYFSEEQAASQITRYVERRAAGARPDIDPSTYVPVHLDDIDPVTLRRKTTP